MVQDFDGDGKAEIAVKTAPGTRDGTGAYLKLGPAANDTDTMAYRNSDGYVLTGPEYLTVFNGQTGAELATVNFDVARGTVSSWGDGYGNRVDRFLSTRGVPRLDGASELHHGARLLHARHHDRVELAQRPAHPALEVRQRHHTARRGG